MDTLIAEFRRNAAKLYLVAQFLCLGILVISIQHGWGWPALGTVIPVSLLGYLLGAELECNRGKALTD